MRCLIIALCAFITSTRGFILSSLPASSLSTGNVRRTRLRNPATSSNVRLSMSLVKELTGEEFELAITEWETPMLLDVFAVWCGPCLLLAPEVELVAEKLGDKCRVYKIDSDKEPDIASALNVYGLPTLLYLKDGGVVFRTEGAMRADAILEVVGVKLFGEPEPRQPDFPLIDTQ